MIITRTPNRISFCGGGTDFPAYFQRFGGIVVGGSIDKYSYIHARYLPPYHTYKSRFVYSSTEQCIDNVSISHPAIRETVRYAGLSDPDSPGIEMLHASDAPAKSGIGSSSTFVVGLYHALCAMKGEFVGADELAAAAIEIEQKRLSESVGCQDQMWAAYGGLNVFRFHKSGYPTVQPLDLDQQHVNELRMHLMLFYTNIPRISSKVVASCKPQDSQLHSLVAMTNESIEAIQKKDWEVMGKNVDMSWRIKRSLSADVTSGKIDELHSAARLAGAFGAKLTGAGGGGSMLVVAPIEKHFDITMSLKRLNCLPIPFIFDFGGSRVIFSDRHGRA